MTDRFVEITDTAVRFYGPRDALTVAALEYGAGCAAGQGNHQGATVAGMAALGMRQAMEAVPELARVAETGTGTEEHDDAV